MLKLKNNFLYQSPQLRKPSSQSKWLLATAFGLLSLGFCIQSQAQTEILKLSAVNITVVTREAFTLTPEQNMALQSIGRVVETKLYPALPSDIAQSLRAHPLKLFLRENSMADGFFTPSDTDPNELQIYLKPSLLGALDTDHIIVHEYFHAVQYLIHPDPDRPTREKEDWLREGMAQYFEYLVLNSLPSAHVLAALRTPSTSLLGLYPDDQIIPELYGHDLLYFYYLFRECGGKDLFWKVARSQEGLHGEASIKQALTPNSKLQCSSFENSVLQFEIARVTNKRKYTAENQDEHYLLSIPMPPFTLIPALTPQILKEMQTSLEYRPFLFSADVVVQNLTSAQFQSVYIHRNYPYETSGVKPEASTASTWLLLVLKK